MNVAMSFHPGDAAQAERWMKWCATLGKVGGNHRLWLMCAKGMSNAQVAKESIAAFATMNAVPDVEGVTGWPAAPNSVFTQFAWHFYIQRIGPWCFIEPDCVPLKLGWLDALEAEYLAKGRPFMGAFVSGQGKDYPDHCSGCAIYPQDTPIQAQAAMMARNAAWDVVGATEIVAKAHFTNLIQHHFKHPGFKSAEEVERTISKEAVLFHSNKDGSLIPFLEAKLKGESSDFHFAAVAARDFPTVQPSVAATNRVFTYFRPGHGEFVEEQKKLLALWEESWKANGWEPIILTEFDAKLHPRFAEWDAALRKLPIKNPIGYEMACFHRWIAMANAGGGLLVDYDLINYAYDPLLLPSFIRLRLFCHQVPCMVLGTAKQYADWIDRFIEMHVASDMGCFVRSDIGRDYDSSGDVLEYKELGWENAKLVHFSHHACGKEPRSAVIERGGDSNVTRAVKVNQAIMDEPLRLNHQLQVATERLIPANTEVGKMRVHIKAIRDWIGDKHSRRNVIHQELRKAGVIAPAKVRKKKSWKHSLK